MYAIALCIAARDIPLPRRGYRSGNDFPEKDQPEDLEAANHPLLACITFFGTPPEVPRIENKWHGVNVPWRTSNSLNKI